jgi:cytochrome c-type biogenesis protein CcsB
MTINETLGEYSQLFTIMAVSTYVVAFLAFLWDMARTGRTFAAVDAKAAGHAGAETKAPAMAGAARAAGAAAVSHEGLAGPKDRVASTGRSGAGAGVVPGEDMKYTTERRVFARVAVALTVLGFLIHAAAVVSRGVAAARVPWGNMYEFCTTGAMVVVGVYLLALVRRDLRFMGSFVLGLVIVMLGAATVGFPTPVAHLVPALQSYWLVIHVSVAVLSSALFTLTFATSVLQLVQARREAAVAAGRSFGAAFLARVPSSLSLENFSYRINAVAFVLWTFTLMAGAIWAEAAWGRYWGWDTKEVWTFVIWVVYAGYLHARATRGWTGTRAAWLSIVGYLCIVFNFSIVNVFFSGLHSYSGIQ